jgi:peroxiredoxin
MTMRKSLALLLFMGVFTGILIPFAGLCNPGKMDLNFNLQAPEDASHRSYLGLETDPFVLNQIQAKIVIIEIFSMYCPICQREAADVNKLFELIQKNPKLKDQVKLIGIGAGNSTFEVDFFKKNYQIEFPLFSDTKFVIHKKIGEVGTPYFIGLTPDKDQGLKIFYSQSEKISDPAQFLQTLVKASGLKL